MSIFLPIYKIFLFRNSWNGTRGGGSLSEKSKFLTFSSHSTLRPIFRTENFYFSRKYLSSTQTWTSFNCPFTKWNNFFFWHINLVTKEATVRLMNVQGFSDANLKPIFSPFDYTFFFTSRWCLNFHNNLSETDDETQSVISSIFLFFLFN